MAPVTAPDTTPAAARRHWHANLRLTALLLAAWFGVGFVIPWFARDLAFPFFGWPFSFWVAAQGGTGVFVALIAVYALVMRRADRRLLAARKSAETTAEEASAHAAQNAAPADRPGR
jgi:putative solute:sodium symporter small subunit